MASQEFVVGGKTYTVRECTVGQMEELDRFLAKLPKPTPDPADAEAIRVALESVTRAFDHSVLPPGEDPAVYLLRWQNALKMAVENVLSRAIEDAGADWPPQLIPDGAIYFLRTPGAKRTFLRVALGGGPELDPAFDAMSFREFRDTFYAILKAFLPPTEDAEGPKAEGGGDGGTPGSTEPTSTSDSPRDSAGPPT